MANIMGIAGIAVTAVALLFAILACALDYWGVIDVAESNFGLWNSCSMDLDSKVCVSITEELFPDSYDDVTIVKAMVLLGLILTVPALIVGILVMFVMKDNKILFFVAGAIDIVAGLFLMVGFAYYVSEVHDSDNQFLSLGAAFALDIVAWILAWVGGALFIVVKIMDKE